MQAFALLVAAATAAPLVRLDMYYESECYGCQDYITTEISAAFDAVPELFELNMFPFGNGKETKNADGSYSFACQHGDGECTGNLLEACGLHFHNGSKAEWFPFINCIELAAGNEGTSPAKAAAGCAKQQGWTDYHSNILPCSTNKLGNSIMHTIATATNHLRPKHTYVPWPVLNGKPLAEAQLDQSLTSVICDAYTGAKPAACAKAHKIHTEPRAVF